MSTTQNARKKLTMAVAQENLSSYSVARAVCKVDSTTMGTIFNPYTSLPSVVSTSGTSIDYTVRAYSSDADALQVNQRARAGEHVDSYDWKSTGFDLVNDRAKNFGIYIAEQIDRSVFNNVVSLAGFNLGDGGALGSTTPWQITSTTADDMVSAAIQQIDVNDGHGKKKFMVVSPYEMGALRGFLQNTGNNVADEVLRRGVNYMGTSVNGVDIYQTNNLQNTAVLTFSGAATNAQTITINGVVLTTVTSIGTTAGNVLIGADVDATVTNIAALINAPRTTTAQGVALSEANASLFERLRLSAVASTGADTVTITAQATLIVSETQTNASWGNVSRRCVAGTYESIFLALPTAGMDYQEKEVGGKAGVEVYMEQFHNSTVWTRMVPLVGTVLTRA